MKSRLRIVLAVYGILFACGVIEFTLRLTLHISDSNQGSVIQQDWQRVWWTPINALGYRDVEPADSALINVLVIGDSFMAGYGIEHIEDRLSGVLQQLLGSRYGVNIAAQTGWESPREFEALQEYPVTPNVVIWSHYMNDILWLDPRYPHVYSFSIVRELSQMLYSTRLLFNAFLPVDNPLPDVRLWASIEARTRHFALLNEVLAWCEERDIALFFVLWDGVGYDTARYVALYLDAANIPYVDMSTVMDNGSPSDVFASPLDGHPSEAMHALAAQYLYTLITTH